MSKPTRIRSKARVHLYLNEWFAVRGYTHQKVADLIGVARNTVSRWANKQSMLDPQKIAQLADVLGIEPVNLYQPPSPLPSRESVDKVLADAPEEAYSAVLNLAKQLSRKAS